MKNGTGADRQLRIFEETKDLKTVVDYMVEETSAGVFAEVPAARKRGVV
jgi:carboxylate-amine ligase